MSKIPNLDHLRSIYDFESEEPKEKKPICERCHGEGTVERNIPGNEGVPEHDVLVQCPECEGTGGPSVYEYTEEEIAEFKKTNPEWFK